MLVIPIPYDHLNPVQQLQLQLQQQPLAWFASSTKVSPALTLGSVKLQSDSGAMFAGE